MYPQVEQEFPLKLWDPDSLEDLPQAQDFVRVCCVLEDADQLPYDQECDSVVVLDSPQELHFVVRLCCVLE